MSPLRAAHSLFIVMLLGASCFAQSSPALVWQRTLDGGGTDIASRVEGDGLGHLYIAGLTDGGLDGPGQGSHDGFLAKYDSAGGLLWTRQIGTAADDHVASISPDASGNVFIAGQTTGALGGASVGGNDAFVSKYDSAGNAVWTRQFGTARHDSAFGVKADGLGNVYVSGSVDQDVNFPYPTDAFLRKYDGSGALLWAREVGGLGDEHAFNVATDGLGNVYVGGDTSGNVQGMNAGSYDAWLAKYDANGNELWRRQRGGTMADFVRDVAADGLGNIFLTGFTQGSVGGPSAGSYDAFVMKYDAAGNHVWTRQFGTTSYEDVWGVAADGLGNVLISGSTQGAFTGMNAGLSDAFVSMYDAAGNPLWTRQLGTINDDSASGVWADGLGSVYVAGVMNAVGRSPSFGDAFLTKLSAVPEPAAALLAAFAAATNLVRRRR